MHNSSQNRFISSFSQGSSASMKPCLYPCQCNSDLFPQMWTKPRLLTTITFDNWTCFLSYLREGWHSWEQKLILSAPNVVLTYLGYFISFYLSPPVYLNDDTLLICSVLVLWFWNHTPPLNVWWVFAHTFRMCWVHGLLVGVLTSLALPRCNKQKVSTQTSLKLIVFLTFTWLTEKNVIPTLKGKI